jgi:hypothetical protein
MPKAPVRGGACRLVGGRKYIGLTGYYDLANGSTATRHYVIIPESDDGEVHVQIDRELVEDLKPATSYVEAALIEHPKLKNEMRLLCKHLAEIKMGAQDVDKLTTIFTSTLQGAIAKNTGRKARHRGVYYTWDEANQAMGL